METESQNTGMEDSVKQTQTGKNYIALSEETIKVEDAFVKAVMSSTGATSLFIGTTRDSFDNKKVLKLEYEAYEPMAIKELHKICDNVREKLSLGNICILHRLGEVPIGEASVIIAVSSVHRKESLDAVSFIIDTLKETVPIWKKEVYEDGKPEWKANKECSWTKTS